MLIVIQRFDPPSPVRLARPRTLGFHPSDRGSNPLREAIFAQGFKTTLGFFLVQPLTVGDLKRTVPSE